MRAAGTGVLTRVVASVDGWQRRHALGGFPLAVLKKFGEDRASSLAALVAYYAFFSLFPLLLAFVSILGFVLEDNPSLRADVVDTALARIPVIGAELRGNLQPLTGSGIALAVGLAGALWAGLGVTLALGRAFAEIWDTPRLEQPGGLSARARGLALLVILAAILVASTATTGLAVGGGIGPAADRGAAVVGSLVVNVVAFLTVFALLSPRPRRLRDLLPGVGLAATGALALQSLGGWYIDRVIVDASAIYGTFAIVIGLLTWFWLVSHLLLIAAEVNVVRRWHLWPRALIGELEPADELALRRSAEAARGDRRQLRRRRQPHGSAGVTAHTVAAPLRMVPIFPVALVGVLRRSVWTNRTSRGQARGRPRRPAESTRSARRLGPREGGRQRERERRRSSRRPRPDPPARARQPLMRRPSAGAPTR